MNEKEKLLSIGEISKMTGAGIKALRHYEKINILKPFKYRKIAIWFLRHEGSRNRRTGRENGPDDYRTNQKQLCPV